MPQNHKAWGVFVRRFLKNAEEDIHELSGETMILVASTTHEK